MTDEELKTMSKDTANKFLNNIDKERWAHLHSATANLYVVRNGKIVDVPTEGWWY